MSAELHWLSNYVMLSRASSLEALLILRMCRREDLENAPPKFLLDEINRLEACEASSWKTLQTLLERQRRQFSKSTWEVIAETYLPVRGCWHDDLQEHQPWRATEVAQT